MQRIDENTYIDDTLVTCAEYQLFIDEMREQGKYYQPDHWTSYQFPTGQARTPVLGVRPSDAKTFCVWLSQLQSGEWYYRLPNSVEANQLSLHVFSLPFGYWTTRLNDQYQFTWMGTAPVNPRNINVVIPFDRERNFDKDIASACNDGLDLDRQIAIAHKRNLDTDLDYYLALTFARNIDRTKYISYSLDLAQDNILIFSWALNLYIDLLTLQERIAGRSPAFEGIRLVKERIR